ncbi:MAG: tRNA lysidine(34) synthetase TilS [Erysipelotrichaceae bacterium]|nr:tRNA lysidine(34) synthetase TilS [Erysipelotrichaceae bacterium]
MISELIKDRQSEYVMGVSGGCDSMALLSLCLERGLKLTVCFVNYKLRKSADDEERLVREYCGERGIEVRTLYPVQKDPDNFQKWAREVRYAFYKEVYDEKQATALLLGHHQDDHLENYLMAQERGSHGWYYGIQPETSHHGMRILRPLLDMRKQETRDYCLANGVPFHDDESNFSDKYQRNRIRHALIEKADDRQIEAWLREIEEFNEGQRKKLAGFEKKYPGEKITRAQFEGETAKEDLIRWMISRKKPDLTLSGEFVRELVRIALNSRRAVTDIGDDLQLVVEYGNIYVFEKKEKYEYVLEERKYFDTEYFAIRDKGKRIESVNVTDEDFPLTIRCWQEGDAIELRYGRKKVSRFLIDRKIPHDERYFWPVIVNSRNELIFVPGIGCDIKHFCINANMFMLK